MDGKSLHLPPDFVTSNSRRKPWRRIGIVLGIGAVFAAVAVALVVTRPSAALGKAAQPAPAGLVLSSGYRIEKYATGLSAPSVVIFDGQDLIVAESGIVSAPRVLRVKPDGTTMVIASTGLRAPVMGLAVANGQLYVSHRGKVSRVGANGRLTDIVVGLPSDGEHSNNGIAFGPDGKLYLAQGTVTNAGIVSPDDFDMSWLGRHPDLHDIPCRDVVTLGQNYQTKNPFVPGSADTLITGAFQSFGSPGLPDQVVNGSAKCNGSILRFNPDGSALEVYAWGLGNPVGLAFDPSGQLWATSQGVAPRGSRVISNDPDYVVRIEKGAWYGWPDYFDGQPVTNDKFKTPGKPEPGFLLDPDPRLSRAYATLPPQSGVGGLGFSAAGSFGLNNRVVLATGGSQNSNFGVGELDLNTRQLTELVASKPGDDRAASVVFGPDNSLYIVDSGRIAPGSPASGPDAPNGAIWRVYSANQQPLRAGGPLALRVPDSGLDDEQAIDLSLLPVLLNGLRPIVEVILGALALAAVAVLAVRIVRT